MHLQTSEHPRLRRGLRNARTILLEAVLFLLVTATLPLLLPAAAVVDAVRAARTGAPWVGVRLVAVAWWFLFGEMRGLVALLGVWLLTGGPFSKDTPRRRAMVWRLQSMWAGGHMDGVRRIFGLRLEIEGDDDVTPGPFVALVRHASIIDNALPAAYVSRPHDLHLRYVLKRELEALPTLDIGGRWVPTCFVRRASDDGPAAIASVRALAEGLAGEREGVLIFPEGTRYTAPKLARAQEKLTGDPLVGPLAARLRHVLPPRLGGPVALLEEARGADVLVVGHVGFDGFETVRDIWTGQLVGRTIRIRIWRYDSSEVPADREDLVRWLYERWQALDDWIEEERRRDPAGTLPPKAAGSAGAEAPAEPVAPTA